MAHYKKGDYTNASKYIKAALKTNSKIPVLLCHAGLITIRRTKEAAKALLLQALINNPIISLQLKAESSMVLKSL